MSTTQNASASPVSLLRIEVLPGEPFKSISELVWDGIPPFTVLTGLNGSGKTQLLDLIAYKLSNTPHPQLGDIRTEVLVTGETFTPDSVAYLQSGWELTGAIHMGLAQMQEAKRQLYQQLRQAPSQNMRENARRMQVLRMLNVSHVTQISEQDFITRMPDDFAFMLDEADVVSGLGHVFLAYRLRQAEELEKGTSHEEAKKKLGPAPWDVVNEILHAAEFPYRVKSPLESSWTDVYQLKLTTSGGVAIEPYNLSSGEKMLLGVALWLYNSKHHNRFPRLFLMDEPDAHLHPSMTRHFLSVLKDVLVDRHGVRVILTTHSPTTIALAPPESLFEMSRDKPRIKPSTSKQATIGLLTAGLVTVSSGTKYVLVEDEVDVLFYEAVRDILTDYGPSRDPQRIEPAPTLVFMPASRGSGATKVGGGCSVVIQWVGKFAGDVLEEIFRGVIDRDINNQPTPRIEVIGRYSIENYILDPFVVYGLLNSSGRAPPVHGVKVSPGDEHLIRDLPAPQLNAIVQAINGLVQPTLSGITSKDLMQKEVEFTNGKKCLYPAWMLDRRGHDLLATFQSTLGGPSRISPPLLINSFRRVRLMPIELASMLRRLQA